MKFWALYVLVLVVTWGFTCDVGMYILLALHNGQDFLMSIPEELYARTLFATVSYIGAGLN